MAREQFFYPATQPLFKKLEQLSRRTNVSRGQASEDRLTAIVCPRSKREKQLERSVIGG